MANFSLDNSEVVRAVLNLIGVGRDPANMDAATEGDVRAIIRSGLRRFYFPIFNGQVHQWNFLTKYHSISAVDPFEDGTIEVTGGTVTLTGGVWPSDITDYFIKVDGHVLFITSRTDDTNVETSHTQLVVAAGTEYEAKKFRYSLPSDFGEWQEGLICRDSDTSWRLHGSTEPEVRLRYSIGDGLNHKTTHYAITSTPDASAQSIVFWPTPEKDNFIQGLYYSVPDDNLPSDLTTPGVVTQVKPIYAEAVMEAILSAAEEYNNDSQDIHVSRFQVALQTAILHDKAVGVPVDFSNQANDYGMGVGHILPISFEP